MVGVMRCLTLLGCASMVSGCFYRVDRHWEQAYAPGIDPPASTKPFRPAIEEGVAKNDPGHLYHVENGGDYQVSGWFLSDKKVDAVDRCMYPKGWHLIPDTLLFP